MVKIQEHIDKINEIKKHMNVICIYQDKKEVI